MAVLYEINRGTGWDVIVTDTGEGVTVRFPPKDEIHFPFPVDLAHVCNWLVPRVLVVMKRHRKEDEERKKRNG